MPAQVNFVSVLVCQIISAQVLINDFIDRQEIGQLGNVLGGLLRVYVDLSENFWLDECICFLIDVFEQIWCWLTFGAATDVAVLKIVLVNGRSFVLPENVLRLQINDLDLLFDDVKKRGINETVNFCIDVHEANFGYEDVT